MPFSVLLGDLVNMIVSHAQQKFGSLIVNTIHQAELSEENRKAFYLEAYPLAGRTVVADVVPYAVSFKARASGVCFLKTAIWIT